MPRKPVRSCLKLLLLLPLPLLPLPLVLLPLVLLPLVLLPLVLLQGLLLALMLLLVHRALPPRRWRVSGRAWACFREPGRPWRSRYA